MSPNRNNNTPQPNNDQASGGGNNNPTHNNPTNNPANNPANNNPANNNPVNNNPINNNPTNSNTANNQLQQQARAPIPTVRATRSLRHMLNIPPAYHPIYRPMRHPWDNRVPPFPFHNQSPPPPAYLGPPQAQYVPYPAVPQRPVVSRPEAFYNPQRVPYQVTTASRPPPSDSVLSYQQAPPRGAGNPRRTRGRRLSADQRRNQDAVMFPDQQNSLERMANGIVGTYDPNNSAIESIDLTRGSHDELLPVGPPLPFIEYNWQDNHGDQAEAYPGSPEYDCQFVPVAQGNMAHHMLNSTAQIFLHELEPIQVQIYQPLVQRTVVGASEVVRQTDARGPGATSILSNIQLPSGEILTVLHTIQYFYTQARAYTRPIPLPVPSGEPMEALPSTAQEGVQIRNPSTSAAQSNGSQSVEAESTTDDTDNGRVSGIESFIGSGSQRSKRTENFLTVTPDLRREPNYLSATAGPSSSPPPPTFPGEESDSMISSILKALEEAMPGLSGRDLQRKQQYIKNPFGLGLPSQESLNRSNPTPSGSASEGVKTLDHLLSENLLQDLSSVVPLNEATQEPQYPPLIQLDHPKNQQQTRDSSDPEGTQMEVTLAVPELAPELPQNGSRPLPEAQNSQEIRVTNDGAESIGQLELDISMFDSINQLLPLPDMEDIVQEVRDMTIDDKLAFDF